MAALPKSVAAAARQKGRKTTWKVNSRPTTFWLFLSRQAPGAQYHTPLQSLLQVPGAPPHPPSLNPPLLQVVAVLLTFKSWRLRLYPASGLVDAAATNQWGCSLPQTKTQPQSLLILCLPPLQRVPKRSCARLGPGQTTVAPSLSPR